MQDQDSREGNANSRVLLGLSTAVLLVVAAELAMHADVLSIWSDETWSILHAGKAVLQILRERDLLWPFVYYRVIHGWMQLVGTTNDFVLHTPGLYLGLLAAACLIRIGRVWRLPSAGLLAALAFGTTALRPIHSARRDVRASLLGCASVGPAMSRGTSTRRASARPQPVDAYTGSRRRTISAISSH